MNMTQTLVTQNGNRKIGILCRRKALSRPVSKKTGHKFEFWERNKSSPVLI